MGNWQLYHYAHPGRVPEPLPGIKVEPKHRGGVLPNW